MLQKRDQGELPFLFRTFREIEQSVRENKEELLFGEQEVHDTNQTF